MELLTAGNVRLLPAASRPMVRPDALRPGIVHLGVGAFHRAHQAVYTEAAMAAGGSTEWGIVGVAPRRRELVDLLRAQDCLFSVSTHAEEGLLTRVVGSMHDVLHAPSDRAGVIGTLAAASTRVVTMTVTEKAYLLDPATGRLAVTDELVAEIDGRRAPSSIPAVLVAGLRARARADAGPITLVSCDNLSSNGRLLRDSVTTALGLTGDDRLASWLEVNVGFPSTMVDRIVPAPTPDLVGDVERTLGVTDRAAVAAEPYSQWVLEDRFTAGRPAWEQAGVVFTDDVTPYERLKLRTLNGAHSTLAYLGALAGCRTIAEAMTLPGMRALLDRFIADDVAPSIKPPDGVDVRAYGTTALERFSNPAIKHRTTQVATDGSQKLPQRIVATIVDRRATGAVPHWAALTLAAWMRVVQEKDDDGHPLPLADPLAAEIRTAISATDSVDQVVAALLGLGAIFPQELADDREMRRQVTSWYRALAKHGARDTVASAT